MVLLKSFFCFLIISIIIALPLINADVYVGTCEGYVRNTETQLVSDAKVIATVDKCLSSCSQETKTNANGYYVVANLNLPKYETLTVYAEKMTFLGLEFGYATGQANEFQAARVDVIICLPPPEPTLFHQPNTHDTSVNLKWVSYADKKNYPVYDEFQMDNNPIIKSNGYGNKNMQISALAFSQHIWRVRTCNNYCCSNWISDSFTIGNQPPSPPNLTLQPDTTPGIVILNWTSGIDPENDETFDEYDFGIIKSISRKTLSPAISPIIEEVFGCNYYTWKVRTCEKESQHLCSIWVEEGFIACGIECPICVSPPGGGSGATKCPPSKQYSLSITSPPIVEEEILLKISFLSVQKAKNIIFKVNSSDFNFNDYFIKELENKKALFNLTGRLKPDKDSGIYNMVLDVFIDNKKEFSEQIEIKVQRRMEYPKITKNLSWIIIIIAIILFLIILWIYIKKKNTKKNK